MHVKIITMAIDVFLLSQQNAYLIYQAKYHNFQWNPKLLLNGILVDHFKQSFWKLFLIRVENPDDE